MKTINRMLIVGVLLAITVSCGKPQHAGFEHWIALFNHEAAKRGVIAHAELTSIRLVDKLVGGGPNTIGMCHSSTGQIELLRSYWDTVSEGDQEALIFHELGHCALDLDHVACPNIMCPTVLDGHSYETYRTEYLDNFFKAVDK